MPWFREQLSRFFTTKDRVVAPESKPMPSEAVEAEQEADSDMVLCPLCLSWNETDRRAFDCELCKNERQISRTKYDSVKQDLEKF